MSWLSEKQRTKIRKLLSASQCPCLNQCRRASGINCINRDFSECNLFKVLFTAETGMPATALHVALSTKRFGEVENG